MNLSLLPFSFAICKVKDYSQIDIDQEFVFISKTDEESSLVCRSDRMPENLICSDIGWRAFRIDGILDFSLVGILAKIASLMADNQIGIFAVSTFNTDYIFIKQQNFEAAILILETNGYMVNRLY